MEADPGFSSSPSILAKITLMWYTSPGAVTYGGRPPLEGG